MSDLRPRGVPVVVDGVERHVLFTLNVIDEIQSETGKTMQEVIEDLQDERTIVQTLRMITTHLLNDEVDREKYKNPECSLKKVSEQEVGWMLENGDIGYMAAIILIAYGRSLPESEEDDPNLRSRRSR